MKKSSAQPKTSLIITSYHTDAEMMMLTVGCVLSLKRGKKPDEVILVDDCSPFKGNVSTLEPLYSGGLVDKRIHRETNGGFPKCANTGWEAATGDILILSNNDLEYTEGWLEAILKPLKEGFDISSLRMSDSDGMETEDKITEGDRFGSLWAMKREVYEALGGFDESFDKGTFEDLDYHKRAEEAGFRIGKNHSVVVKHQGRATMDKLYPDRRDFHEGKIHFERKHGYAD